jgi:peptidoglycan hydrolase-like protein with peptidoglycan-binding domain
VTTIRWLIGLATIAALAWFVRDMDDARNRRSIVELPSTQDLPPTELPAIGLNRPFSVPEIRWCMSQDIRLRTIKPRLGTRRAIDRYNEIADDYNLRCKGLTYSRADGEDATRTIDGARNLIAAAALEDIQRLNGEGLTRQIQELLAMLGYEPGAVDGLYGTQTKVAIEAFQRAGRSDVDGLLSQELLDRLRFTHTRHLMGRDNAATETADENAQTAHVVVRVIERPQETATDVADAQAVSGAEVKLVGNLAFNAEQLTDERGRAEFAAVPIGKLNIDVRRNNDHSGVIFQVTQDPAQEIWITLPKEVAASAQVSKKDVGSPRR